MKGSMIHIVYISCHNFGIACEITSKILIVSMNFSGGQLTMREIGNVQINDSKYIYIKCDSLCSSQIEPIETI